MMRTNCFRHPVSFALIALIISLLAVPQSSLASTDVLSQARNMIARKDFKAAAELLQRNEGLMAGNIDFDYMLGTAALDAGMADTATIALERVLALRPGFMGARLDLARAYFLLGDIDRSKQEFEIVGRNNPPPAAKAVLEAYLKRITDVQEEANRPYRFFVEYGYGRDSNINFSGSSSQISIPVFGGAVFTLNPLNVATAKDVSQLVAGVEYEKKIAPDFGVIGNYSYRLRDNINSSDFDTVSQDYTAGVYWGLPTNRLTLSIDGGRYDLNSNLSRVSSGFSADWKYALGPRNQITLFTKENRTRFVGDLNINSFNSTVTGMNKLFILPDGGGGVNATLMYGEEDGVNGRADGNKYFHGIRLMGFHKLAANWDTGLMAGSTWAQFQRSNASFLRRRADKSVDQGLFLNYRVDSKTLINMSISRINNSSNIGLYDFVRTEYLLKLRRTF